MIHPTPEHRTASTSGGPTRGRPSTAKAFRPIPGLECYYAITANSKVRDLETGEVYDVNDWPKIYIPVFGGTLEIDVVAATAAAWLDPEAQDLIRAKVKPRAPRNSTSLRVMEEQLGVSKHAIILIANGWDAERVAVRIATQMPMDQGAQQSLTWSFFERYVVGRLKFPRPAMRGGNAIDLHKHAVVIEGQLYSWIAVGPAQQVDPGSVVCFSYMVAEEERIILRHTIQFQAGPGKPIRRVEDNFPLVEIQ